MSKKPFPSLPYAPDAIVDTLGVPTAPVLLVGAPGSGKSTLAHRLALAFAREGIPCLCLGADPGNPAFGLPGALSLAAPKGEGWDVLRQEALCTLDAGRFRLPLLLALRRLLEEAGNRPLLIDGPGVVRGVAGRETTTALLETLGRPIVLALAADVPSLPLADELRTLGGEVWHLATPAEARRPGKGARAHRRTAVWDGWLERSHAEPRLLELDAFSLLGTPPPRDEPSAWPGRQVALLRGGRTLTLGEIEACDGSVLRARLPPLDTSADTLLIRDAQRRADGLLGTAEPFVGRRPVTPVPLPPPPPLAESPPLIGRCGPLDYSLVNGVFGDPALHLRLRHAGRSLLFDLGEVGHLSARLAHQVSDVFISHAHMDHLAGFQWLLRSRLGEFPPCRIYGPPGLARHLAAFVESFLWDRIGGRGPLFEITELHGQTLRRWRLQAGIPGMQELSACPTADGVLHEENGFRIRALELDHHTTVLAFAFEPAREIRVRRDRLQALDLEPGPWLRRLKEAILGREPEIPVPLPDGRVRPAGELAEELLLIRPGKRLVYATDLADTPHNRSRLIPFARHAHTFFCESPFLQRDAENAIRNGHLTTRACAGIAAAAEVGVLVPFHFSRRYQANPEAVYDELGTGFPRLLGR
ncbi:MAG TPA: hypothetical protein ENK54_06610 [Thiotrichales bacterium]|nr:hypothetical protein [Thiotrichales bacterium]